MKAEVSVVGNYPSQNEGIECKVFLATSPQSHPPTSPHPALPYLKGYLAQTLPHVQVTQKDLDAIYFAYFFSQQELEKRFSHDKAQQIRTAYQAQRESRIYQDIPRFIDAHRTLEEALDEISRQHRQQRGLKKESLQLRGNTFTYISEYPANSRVGILKAIKPENREQNLFYGYYQDTVVPYIVNGGYEVVGLSVFLTDQLIPTFLLASMLKDAKPDIKIILGGNYVSRFCDVLSQDDELNRQLFDYADILITKNGEIPFTQVVEELGNKQKDSQPDFSNVGQLIYKRDGKIIANPSDNLTNIHPNLLPRPDFEGIFTDLEDREQVFWTPEPVISFYTQRGCPYVKRACEFCAIPTGNNVPNSGLQRDPWLVADDIEFYRRKYGTKYFSFGNETLTRKFMLELSEELDKRGIEAIIDGYTRTDQFERAGQIDRDMIKKVSKYFKFLQIGFESQDQETLDSMVKERKPFNDSDLAAALFANGIFPHAFLMIGFPPENENYSGKSRNEFVEFYLRSGLTTLDWLLRNKHHIVTFKATGLVLPRDSKMVNHNGSISLNPNYAHEIQVREPRDLEYNVPYSKINGSRDLDHAITELFDLVPTPYRTFTHHAIYHQRQFMWNEGLSWSLDNSSNPSHAELLFPIQSNRTKRVLQKIWNAAVGYEYRNALKELSKKGGVSREKKEKLETVIADTQQNNIVARQYPHGIESIAELVALV